MSWIFFCFCHKFAEFISKYLVHELIGLKLPWKRCHVIFTKHDRSSYFLPVLSNTQEKKLKKSTRLFSSCNSSPLCSPVAKASLLLRSTKEERESNYVGKKSNIASSVIGERVGTRLSPPPPPPPSQNYFVFTGAIY